MRLVDPETATDIEVAIITTKLEAVEAAFLGHKICRYGMYRVNTGNRSDSRIAKIITNQPLRAKEASPFVSSKYPVVVGCKYLKEQEVRLTIQFRTTNMMRSSSVPVALA